jgi:hypothetical protein
MKSMMLALGTVSSLAFTPRVIEPHPHITTAIVELQAARKELQTEAHDFGGHRVAAMRAVDNAIKQLQIAQRYDKQ